MHLFVSLFENRFVVLGLSALVETAKEVNTDPASRLELSSWLSLISPSLLPFDLSLIFSTPFTTNSLLA